MNVAQVAAEILKREGVEHLLAYPLNPLTESAAAVGIRPIIVRQERIGAHMADAISRLSSGEKVGVFVCQAGPGIENTFGAVAQAWSECVPLVIIPGASARIEAWVRPNFNSAVNFQHITKACEQINTPQMIVPALRRAFALARNGRPGPVLIEVPGDMWTQEFQGEIDYVPSKRVRSAPDPKDIDAAAARLIAAKRPLIYSGQGVHYSKGWEELRAVAELLEAPVTTSLEGKSSFPETHPLSLGSGGVAMPKAVYDHVMEADVVFGVGASFTLTSFGIKFPVKDKSFIHNTIDAGDIDKGLRCDIGLVGDSKLALGMLLEALRERLKKPRGLTADIQKRIAQHNEPWLKEWLPRLTSKNAPISPYRVINDLQQVADVANTVITHDAGSPRDELSPFWKTVTPLSYIGWGKSTQLGYGLGLALGAKLAQPQKLCMNMWGDAAIGMTGMDFETAVRCNIPIMSILFNNYRMAMEDKIMAVSKERFASTDISGHYADFAKALGGYSERIEDPARIPGALRDGIKATQEGRAVLLEFITTTEKIYSTFQGGYGAP